MIRITEKFSKLIRIVQLYKGKIEINKTFNIILFHVSKKNIDIIYDYLINRKFVFKGNDSIINVDLENNHIDNPKWKSNDSYIPISEHCFTSLYRQKEKLKSWNSSNDYLYFENG